MRAIVQPFVLRRAKDSPEVELELPPITIEKDYCRLTVEQASLYQATVDRWMPRIEEQRDSFGQRGSVLAMLSQLKRVCNHPELLLADRARRSTAAPGSSTGSWSCSSSCPPATRRSSSRSTRASTGSFRTSTEQLGKPVGFFHGRLSARQRDDVLRAFETPDGPSVLVISIKAGGRGLNLPAANHVIHFDRWWNPAVEQQATDRVHRVGQRKPVFVHSLICVGTLEERIDQLLESKRELAAKVIHAGSEDWLGELDLGAIRAAVALVAGLDGGGGMSDASGAWAVGAARSRPRSCATKARRSRSGAARSCATARSARSTVDAGDARRRGGRAARSRSPRSRCRRASGPR